MSNLDPAAQGDVAPTDHERSTRDAKSAGAIKKHVRGSLLLLGGRGIGIFLNLAVQVLLVRALTVADYGSFAFGLSIASMGTSFARVGLDKGVTRFASMHDERAEYAEMAGVVVLSLLLVLSTGTAVVGLVYLSAPWLGSLVPADISVSVLLILVCLAPTEALDAVMMQVLAMFGSAKALAVRRHIITPALRLAAVASLMVFGGSVQFLALAWTVAIVVSTVLSGIIVAQALRQRDLLKWFRPGAIRLMPGRLLRFSIPLLSSDVSIVVRGQLVPFLLGILRTGTAVASYRAVMPIARLNLLVSDVFAVLLLPAAGRMYATNDYHGLRDLYWRVCAWILVLTYPVFLVTFTLADTVSVLLFGDRYAASAPIMQWLAIGFFVDAVITNNTIILQQMSGSVRRVVMIDTVTLIAALVLNFSLIWLYGAIGGAAAQLLTAGVRAVASQALMERSKSVGLPTRSFVRITATAGAMALAVLLVENVFDAPLTVMVPLVAFAAIVVVLRGTHELEVASTFPELLRIPLVGQLLAKMGAH